MDNLTLQDDRAHLLARIAQLELELDELRRSVREKDQRLEEVTDELGELEQLRLGQTILNCMGDGLLVVDKSGRIVLSNPAARHILGAGLPATIQELAQNSHAFFEADTVTPIEKEFHPLTRALRGESCEQVEIFVRSEGRPQGFWLSVAASPVWDPAGELKYGVITFFDMTLRRLAMEKLALHDRALASTSEGITISDARQPDNPIIYVNSGFERLTQYSAAESMGRNCRFLQGPHSDREVVEQLQRAIAGGERVTVELINYRKDGAPFWNRLSITPIFDAAGVLTHFVGVQSDISEIKDTQLRLQTTTEELRRAHQEAMRANHRMKNDLDTAAKIQNALLPSEEDLPDEGPVRFAWRFQPCEELAGDSLTINRLDDAHWGVCVLDVCGHGVAAALLSVTVRRFLSARRDSLSLVWDRIPGTNHYAVAQPAKVAERLNARFPWNSTTAQFFTLFYGVLNTETFEFQYVSAGHPPALYLTAHGAADLLGGENLPIGLTNKCYIDHKIQLDRGDRVFLYSDGITDVPNPDQKLFGLEALTQTLQDARGVELERSLDHVLEAVGGWSGGRRAIDDLTLVALEVVRGQ
jgi:phosphoserine phosphatase RsbU/P